MNLTKVKKSIITRSKTRKQNCDMRFQVHDDIGHLRSFHSKSEAIRFLSYGKRLVVMPKQPKPKFDFSKFEDALF